jgi:chromosome partitioning protein
MLVTYALANQKGGVGKTTTVVNLGAYLAKWGQRILVVDIDPQANATSSLGVDKRTVPLSVYDLLVRDMSVDRVVQRDRCPGLDLVPAAPALAGATVELVNLPQRELRLRRALAELDQRYDYVLIDCPPSLGLLTVNALAATDGVIIPVQCEYLALEGLSQLVRAVGLVRKALNPTLRLRGVVLTMYDVRTSLARQVVEEVRRHFPGRVFNTIIPRNVRLSEAPGYGDAIVSYAPSSAGALAYAALTRELLAEDGQALPRQPDRPKSSPVE